MPRALNERSLLLTLAFIQFAHITDFVIMMPLGPVFLRVFQLQPSDFSLLVSAYTVSAAVASLAGAFFLDRFDRRPALLVLFSGFLVATALCGLSQTFPQLLLARTAAGAFGGTVSTVSIAIVGDLIVPERRGRAMGILMAAFSAATVVGLPLGLAVAAAFSWHWVFLGIAILGMGVGAIAAWVVPPVRGHLGAAVKISRGQELARILGSSKCRRGLAFIASVMGASFLIIPFLSPSLVANVGVREDQLSLVYFSAGLCTLFTSQAIGWASDRWGHRTVFFVVATFSTLPILLMTNLPPLPIWQVLPFSAFFMIFVSGRMVPSLAILTSLVPSEERGGYMSLVSFSQQLSMGIASYVGGWIVARGPYGELLHYPVSGALAVGITILSLWLASGLRPQNRQSSPTDATSLT